MCHIFEKRCAKIRAQIANGDMYTLYAMTNVANYESKASGHSVSIFHRENEMFEVTTAAHGLHMDKGKNKQIVNLKENKCSCNKWQSFGIPCSHVLDVCAHATIDSWQYVDKYFTMDAYARCYAPQFFPIPHKSYWSEPNFPILHPNPTLLREKGRPRSSRIRNEMDWKEPSIKIRCGICKQEGHNRLKCPTKFEGQSSNNVE